MSLTLERPADATVAELLYTICPVLVASNVAQELGWLDDELAHVGARATYLRSLPGGAAWRAHYDHGSERLIRDGGNSPAIWARADRRPTVLVGLTQAQPAGRILVRAEDKLWRLADLRGRRVGLYRSLNAEKIDHRRATSERGLLQALALHGLARTDVVWVDVDDPDSHSETPAPTPAGIWRQHRGPAGTYLTHEARALLAGEVDAIYDYSVGGAAVLERGGRIKTILDLDDHPDWTLAIANAPRTITVSAELAELHRDLVVAFLRAAIRAGRWIAANPDAAARVFARTTIYPDAEGIARALPRYDLVPNLSERNLTGLAIEAAFLRAHGYIAGDLDVYAWADPSFLAEAINSLGRETTPA